MRESTWRKIDRIYTTKQRRRLAQIYRGDPAEAVNSERVMREEIIPSAYIPEKFTPPRFPWLTKLRKRIQ